MTTLDYTDPIPTPAPVTSGSGPQTFQDPLGDWWVAQNGVYGGQWRRARDVVISRVYRNAALTPSGTALFPYDAVDRDPYGFYNTTSSLFTVPVAGWYRIICFFSTNVQITTGQFVAVYFYRNGAQAAAGPQMGFLTGQGNFPVVNGVCLLYCNPGDTLGVWYGNSSTAVAVRPGINWTTANFEYVGSG